MARSVGVLLLLGFLRGWGVGFCSSGSLWEEVELGKESMLSRSSSEILSFPSSITSAVASSSAFRRFSLSASTLTPSPSPVSLSTSSHVLFLSRVNGMLRLSRSSRSAGSLSSSRRLRNRSSRVMASRAFFCFTCSYCEALAEK